MFTPHKYMVHHNDANIHVTSIIHVHENICQIQKLSL